MNQIGLNRKVIVEKFRGERAVRENPADFCRRDHDVLGIRFSKKMPDLPTVSQVQLLTGSIQQMLVPLGLKKPYESRPYHAPMTGYINARICLHSLHLFRLDIVFGSIEPLAFSFKIRIHHHMCQFFKSNLRLPSQIPFGFARVADEEVHLGGTIVL